MSTMTREQAAALIARHGSQRAAARAAGCSHHTIARALSGQGAHRGVGGGQSPCSSRSSSPTGWQRSTMGPTYAADEEDDAGVSWAPIVVIVLAAGAAWLWWRWWRRERVRRQGQGPGALENEEHRTEVSFPDAEADPDDNAAA